MPFSVILVHGGPGTGPRVHRHPYPEVFVVEAGAATFRLGDEDVVVGAGPRRRQPVGRAARVPEHRHGRAPAHRIHGAGRFATEWLEGDDPVWTSPPRR